MSACPTLYRGRVALAAEMAQALKVGGFKTRKAAVEEGLRLLVRTRAQGRLRGLRGKLRWEGSIEEMRRDR